MAIPQRAGPGAELLPHPFWRASALVRLAEVVAAGDPDRAARVAAGQPASEKTNNDDRYVADDERDRELARRCAYRVGCYAHRPVRAAAGPASFPATTSAH